MSFIVKIALTSFVSGIVLILVSFILGLFDDFDDDGIWYSILVIGALLSGGIPIGLTLYLVGYILIKIWT